MTWFCVGFACWNDPSCVFLLYCNTSQMFSSQGLHFPNTIMEIFLECSSSSSILDRMVFRSHNCLGYCVNNRGRRWSDALRLEMLGDCRNGREMQVRDDCGFILPSSLQGACDSSSAPLLSSKLVGIQGISNCNYHTKNE